MKANKKRWIRLCAGLISLIGALFPLALGAQDYTSTHFIVRDPIITIEGGRSTSQTFQYFSSTGQTVVGENTSSTFKQRSGFLYFPIVSTPVVSATAGNAQVALSWTAATADLGWSVGGYQVGQSTVSGGSYRDPLIKHLYDLASAQPHEGITLSRGCANRRRLRNIDGSE